MISQNRSQLFGIIERLAVSTWQRTFERSQRIRGWLLKVSLVLSGSLSKEVCISAYLVSTRVLYLYKKSGGLFCALYLKQCSSSLQMAYGGIPHEPSLLPVFVSLTRQGYPRIIPAHHRKMMYKKDQKADYLVKLYLSWFSLSKLIRLAPSVSKKTFESINKPVDKPNIVARVISEFTDNVDSLIKLYTPWISEYPIFQGIIWEPTWKVTPNSEKEIDKKRPKSLFTSLWMEILAYGTNLRMEFYDQSVIPSCSLWYTRTVYPLDNEANSLNVKRDCKWFLDLTNPPCFMMSLKTSFNNIPLHLGKLSNIVEGGGKRRIIAIGLYIKQRLLKPYHDWCMSVLRHIPNDGTYDQERPIKFLKGRRFLYSFDLKSATDRFPLSFSQVLFDYLFGSELSSSIVECALGDNVFDVPFCKKGVQYPSSSVVFNCGQPLGYYLSWPLFTFSHHCVVWMAAHRVYPGVKFKAYAILGDDIVIGDSRVAQEYSNILSDLQVTISTQKSLVSDKGACEFAKRFYVNKGFTDLSPVSIKSLHACNSIIGLINIRNKYKVPYVALCRVGGAGYKTLGSIHTKRSKKWERLWVAFNKPSCGERLPFEFWLGRGYPLNPYLKGLIVDFLRKELKPKELKLVPEELTFENQSELLEYTLIHQWMKSWLQYVYWFHTVALNLDPSLVELFDVPLVETSWRGTKIDKDLYRFGLVWKVYDMVGQRGLSWRPPILSPDGVQFDRWILGGYKGTDFIMAPIEIEKSIGKKKNRL